jgi:FdhE protein
VDLNVDAEVLKFLLYHTLWPSMARNVSALAALAPGQGAWNKGYCPMCGSLPMLALLGMEGERSLVCGFCRHAWPVPRIFCPFCESRDARSMEYFFSDSEKHYRVYTCQHCRSYCKTVDLRAMARPCYPPLEAVLTAHLDLQAQQMGFRNAAPSWLAL